MITPDTRALRRRLAQVGGVDLQERRRRGHGALALRQALTVSSDVFFYQLGPELNSTGDGQLLQHWARRSGIGRQTGIDLPGERQGLIPTPRVAQPAATRRSGFTDRPWSVGDNINLVGRPGRRPGQPAPDGGGLRGDRQRRQRACARTSASGSRTRPGARSRSSRRRAARKLKIDAGYRQAILDGLRGAASGPGGTSTAGVQGLPDPDRRQDRHRREGPGPRRTSPGTWRSRPTRTRKYVVAVTDEHGGFGADTAAPEARKILAELFDVKQERKPARRRESAGLMRPRAR